MLEGLRYAAQRPDLLGTYLVDFVAMFFGMPNALFPALASAYGGATVLGLFYAAPSFGAALVAATSGWTNRVRRHGRAIVVAALIWGVAIVGLGLAHALPFALLALAVAGGADAVSGFFRATIWNQSIPDELRGRMAGLEFISYSSGPALGNVEAGAVANWLGPRISVLSGGVLCVAGVVIAAARAVQAPGGATRSVKRRIAWRAQRRRDDAERADLTGSAPAPYVFEAGSSAMP